MTDERHSVHRSFIIRHQVAIEDFFHNPGGALKERITLAHRIGL
jgi:hypothetical protein